VGNKANGILISRALLSSKLAACVNILSNVRSVYRWKGQIKDGRELLLIVKTTDRNLNNVEKTIRKLHTYETPEILSLRIDKGSKDYLGWLADETMTKGRK
jgi:periplasmic divalent cation tolerance protein